MSRQNWLRTARELHEAGVEWNTAQKLASRLERSGLGVQDLRGEVVGVANRMRAAGVPFGEAQRMLYAAHKQARQSLGLYSARDSFTNAASRYYRNEKARRPHLKWSDAINEFKKVLWPMVKARDQGQTLSTEDWEFLTWKLGIDHIREIMPWVVGS